MHFLEKEGKFHEIFENLEISEKNNFSSYIPDMRLGLHFCEADTPPLIWRIFQEKSEIY